MRTLFGLPGGTVAYKISLLRDFEIDYARFPDQYWLNFNRVLVFLQRTDAIEKDPRSHHIEMGIRQLQDAARIRHVTDWHRRPHFS